MSNRAKQLKWAILSYLQCYGWTLASYVTWICYQGYHQRMQPNSLSTGNTALVNALQVPKWHDNIDNEMQLCNDITITCTTQAQVQRQLLAHPCLISVKCCFTDSFLLSTSQGQMMSGEWGMEPQQWAREPWNFLHHQRASGVACQPCGDLQRQHPVHADCQRAGQGVQVRPGSCGRNSSAKRRLCSW